LNCIIIIKYCRLNNPEEIRNTKETALTTSDLDSNYRALSPYHKPQTPCKIILLEVYRGDLDEDLELISPEKGNGNVAIGGLVLEGDLGLNAENKGSAW
jgi:hypothetical protein